MVPLDMFMTRLMPWVPGCPEPTALAALLDSATDFCDRTRALRVTTEPMTLVAGQREYDLDLPPDTEPVQFVRAWVDGTPLALVSEAMRFTQSANGVTGDLGSPAALLPLEGSEVALEPAPDRGGPRLAVRLALRPTAEATQVMDALFTRWRDAVVGGAAARLASQPGKAYSNPTTAVEGAAAFMRGVSSARVESNRDLMPGVMRVIGAPFA